MVKKDHTDYDVLDCYILNEQPMTCGICGARTSFEERRDGTQLHQCLKTDCGNNFIVVDDAN